MNDNMISGNIQEYEIETMIIKKLQKILEDIPILSDVKVIDAASNEIDIEAYAKIDRRKNIHILCEVKNKAEPLNVRKAVDQLINYMHSIKENQPDFYGMIAAPYISETSGKICEETGMGYIDLIGNCLIKYQSIYVRTRVNSNKYKERRGEKAVYERTSTVSSIILRNLLLQPEKRWRIRELAETSAASTGQVSKVKNYLEEREYIKIDNKGFFIDKPKEMLTDWAKVYNQKKDNIYEYYSLDSIPTIEQKLIDMRNEKKINSVLTGFAGGVRYIPVVRYNKIHVYIQYQDLQEAVKFLGIKNVASGANISLIIPYDSCVLVDTRNIKNSIVASPVQVSLDLLGMKGRGEEAASAIIDKEFNN